MTRLVIIIATLTLAYCQGRQISTKARILSSNNAEFALNLYKQVAKADGNLFFSPHSILEAFAMLHLGARGNTKTQIEQV